VVEYLRSFLIGRTGWAALGTLLLISGAFGVYRRDVVVEAGGLVLVPLGVLLGVVDVRYALVLLLVSYGYAIFVTLAAICAEEWAFHRYEGWGDLGAAVAGAVFENLGYRQMTVAWRLEGWWASLRGKQQVWGVMTRRGFEEEAA
jgi:cellulose synthase/poly-beta-1,6-N-acetylglucosamine synthase-like glycosyltransferase